jgi:hypothetical protein
MKELIEKKREFEIEKAALISQRITLKKVEHDVLETEKKFIVDKARRSKSFSAKKKILPEDLSPQKKRRNSRYI